VYRSIADRSYLRMKENWRKRENRAGKTKLILLRITYLRSVTLLWCSRTAVGVSLKIDVAAQPCARSPVVWEAYALPPPPPPSPPKLWIIPYKRNEMKRSVGIVTGNLFCIFLNRSRSADPDKSFDVIVP